MFDQFYGRREFIRRGVATTLVAGTLLAGCGSSAVSSGDNTLDVAVWGGAPDIQSLQNAAASFMKAFPHIKIKLRTGDCGASYPACKTFIAGNTMPDVFVPGIWNYNTMVNDGVLENLKPYVSKDNLALSDFNPTVMKQMQALKDGEVYGLPMGFNVQSLYYNKDMFDKVGLAYPPADGNYTWHDLRDWAKKLTIDGQGNRGDSANFNPQSIKQWGYFTLACTSGAAAFDPVLTSFGGSTMTISDHQHCNLEHPDSIRAWQFIQDLMWKDHSTVTPQVNQEEAGYLRWVAGSVAMQQGSHEQTPLVNQRNPGLNYDMAALPKEKAGNATALQMHIWSIYSGSKKKDLAWQFVKWVSTIGSGTEMGLVPAYKDYALGDKFVKAPKEAAHVKEAQLDPTAWPLALVPTCDNQRSDEISGQDGFGPALTAIITNKMSAADALRGINKKVDAIMAS